MSEDQHIPLQADELGRLEAARNWIKGHFTVEPDQKYDPLEGKLRVVEAILANGWVERDETWKLQALGIALGDALAQKFMLDWVTFDDEYGRDPALNWPGTAIYCFPMTMISKRIEDGDQVNVREIFEFCCADLSDLAFSGRSV